MHKKNKHGTLHTGSETVPMEQTNTSHSLNEKHSSLQDQNINQLYENIDQWHRVSQCFLLPVNTNWQKEISCDNKLMLS